MKRILIFIFVFQLCQQTNAEGSSLGIQLGLSGGPAISILGIKQLSDQYSVDLALGGFPGIISQTELNLRIETDRKYPQYFRTGIGSFRFYRGQGEGHSITEIHAAGGLTKIRGKLRLSAEIGLIYVPPIEANDWRESIDDYEISVIPIVPRLVFLISYPLP